MKTIKEILNDERTTKIVKVFGILSLMISTARLVFCVVNYGPKIVERVKNKIVERKMQKYEATKIATLAQMYVEVGKEGINDYVEEHEDEFMIINELAKRLNEEG